MKALIVDDSDFQRSEIKELLTPEGFECYEAFDGQDALSHLERMDDFAFIVTDLNMPRMNGIEFTARARSMPHYQNVPIFMLTTDVTQESKTKGKEVGLTAWIVKPLKSEPFVRTLRKVMEKQRAG